MNVTRRTALKLGSAFTLAPALLKGGAAFAGEQFRVLIPTVELIGYGELYLPLADGSYEKEGLDVTILPTQGSSVALTQVLAGQADLCRCGSVDVINAAVKQGGPVAAIATNMPGSPLWVISSGKKPIASPEDFKGKTIGVVSFGGFTENALDMMAAKIGLGAGTVKREAVGNAPGAFSLIEQGRIDGFIASTSTAMALKADGADVVAWNTFDHLKIPGQVYAVNTDTIAKKPEQLQAFIRAVHAGMGRIFDAENDLSGIVDELKQFPFLDAKDPVVGAAALKAELPMWAATGRENVLRNIPELWTECLDSLIAAELLSAGSSIDGVYTNQFVDGI